MRSVLKNARRERKALPGSAEAKPIAHSDFPEHQIKRLRAIGIDPTPRKRSPGAFDPVASYAKHYEEIVATSLTTLQVAAHLQVSEGRIRQRLTSRPPTLYAIKVGHEWRIPRFQFDDRMRLVPGLERVVASLASDLGVVAFSNWFTTPSRDFEVDERPVSPKDWLRAGNPVDFAAAYAAHLDACI